MFSFLRSQEGQDFLANHRNPYIDFATVHAWPDNWVGFADYSTVMSNPVRRPSRRAHETRQEGRDQRRHLGCFEESAPVKLGAHRPRRRSPAHVSKHLQQFDYTFGSEVWKEKLDYLQRWLKAHVEDSDKMNMPIILGERSLRRHMAE